jgi:hypothetical protein
MKEAQLQNQSSAALTGLGQAESQAATSGLKTGAELGALEQAFTQAQINAPLTQATNVSQLLKGYTVPTTQEQTYKGPGDAFQPSPLSQIASLGSLLASGFNPTGTGFGNLALKALGGVGSVKTPDQAINDYFKSTGKSIFDYGSGDDTDITDFLSTYNFPASNVEDGD